MLWSSIAIGARTLAANPLRTTLAALGVVVGTASLVAVLALGDGVEAYARRQLAETTDLQLAQLSARNHQVLDGLVLPLTDTLRFTMDDLASLRGALGATAAADLRLTGGAELGGFGDDTTRGSEVIAWDAGAPLTEPNALAAGRWFTEADLRDTARAVIVTQALAGRLTGSTDHAKAVGRTITLQGTTVTIVGVAAVPATPRMVSWVPRPLFTSVVAPPYRAAAPTFLVLGRSIEEMSTVVPMVERWMKGRWPGKEGQLSLVNRADRLRQAQQSMVIFKLLMGSITGISLIVGGIGIMNVLLASVFERTREIGVRRATGARRRDIVTQFLAESVAVTASGSAIGVVLGIGGAFAIAAVMRIQTKAPVHAAVTPGTLAIAAGSAVLVGLIFGLYPAKRAANLSPIDAIRHE